MDRLSFDQGLFAPAVYADRSPPHGQMAEEDIRRATDTTTPVEGRFETLARARRYLGVNDAFAHMLVNGFRRAWA